MRKEVGEVIEMEIRSIDDFNKKYFPKQYEKDYYESLSLEEKVKYDVEKMFKEIEVE